MSMDLNHAKHELKRVLQRYPGLRCQQRDESLFVGTIEEPETFSICHRDGWVIATLDGHCHRESLSEVLDQFCRLVSGADRFTNEFRGDKLVANWLESCKGEYYEVSDLSLYACPLDADEWNLWDGETWKQVRTTLQFAQAAISRHDVERAVESPHSGPIDWMQSLFEAPPIGFKWTSNVASPLFYHLAPVGWRQIASGEGFRDLASSQDPNMVLRARTYYREAQSPTTVRILGTILPSTSAFEHVKRRNDWSYFAWTFNFSDGQQEALAMLELFYLPSAKNAATTLRKAFDRAPLLACYRDGTE